MHRGLVLDFVAVVAVGMLVGVGVLALQTRMPQGDSSASPAEAQPEHESTTTGSPTGGPGEPTPPVDWTYTASGQARGVAVDSLGNSVVTGEFKNTTMVAGTTLEAGSGYDILLVKLDRTGEMVWARGLGGGAFDVGVDIDVDPDDNVVVTGLFQGRMDLGNGVTVTAGAGGDVFVAKFAPDGTALWARSASGPGRDAGNEIATGEDGRVIVTGTFSESLAFPGGPSFTGRGGLDVFVAVYESDGTLRWAEALTGAGTEQGRGVEVDGDGNVLLVGEFDLDLDVDGQRLMTRGNADAYATRWSPGGELLWVRQYGGLELESARAVDSDEDGNFYFGGRYQGTLDLGGITLTSSGGSLDVFLVRARADGTPIWARSIGGPGADEGMEMEVDPGGIVTVSGHFSGTGAWSDDQRTIHATAGGTDEFVARYNTDGALAWVSTYGGPLTEWNFALGVGPDGASIGVGMAPGKGEGGIPPLSGEFYLAHRPRPALILSDGHDARHQCPNATAAVRWAMRQPASVSPPTNSTCCSPTIRGTFSTSTCPFHPVADVRRCQSPSSVGAPCPQHLCRLPLPPIGDPQ